MKRLLRNCSTNLYWQTAKKWVARAEDAAHFDTFVLALDTAYACVGERVEIVLNFGEPKYDIVLPIGSA